jgi:hypothetical protein
VNVKLLISNSHSLDKVFHCNFLVMMRNVEIPESCPARDRAGRRGRHICSFCVIIWIDKLDICLYLGIVFLILYICLNFSCT